MTARKSKSQTQNKHSTERVHNPDLDVKQQLTQLFSLLIDIDQTQKNKNRKEQHTYENKRSGNSTY